jgi:hypothetical protein
MITEHALDVFDRKCVDGFFIQLIPYRMQQEYPKLSVLLGIRTVDAHNEHGKRDGNRGRVFWRGKPGVSGRDR